MMSFKNHIIALFTVATMLLPFMAGAQTFEPVYDNIGLVSWNGNGDRAVLEVYPMGNTNDILFSYGENAEVSKMRDGSLRVRTGEGTFYEKAPVAYQESPNGDRIAVQIAYKVMKNKVYLQVGAYEMAQVLTIDLPLTQPSFSFLDENHTRVHVMTMSTMASMR